MTAIVTKVALNRTGKAGRAKGSNSDPSTCASTNSKEHASRTMAERRSCTWRALHAMQPRLPDHYRDRENLRGHYERGLFTGGISRIPKFARIARDGRILLCFPQSGGSLESLESLNSLENGFSERTPSGPFPNIIAFSPAVL